MKILDANRSGLTVIGRQGENRRTAVRFPVSAEVFEEYPEATVQVLHQRFGDPAAYPVHEDEYRVDSDGVVVWTVLSGDTAKCGRGQCELVFSEGDVVVLTIIYATQVLPSLSAGEEPPEPWESWTREISRSRDAAAESAEEAGRKAAAAADSAEKAARSAEEAAETVKGVQEKVDEAGRQAAAAAKSAEDASQAKTDAEAWAVGQRDGEDVEETDITYENNSEYYANQAKTWMDRAEQAALEKGYMDFFINDKGHLIYERTDNIDNIDFELNEGRLIALWPAITTP